MMRYLIYRFLYENGRKTCKNFENSYDNDWKQIEGALKTQKNFARKVLISWSRINKPNFLG